MSQRLIMQGGSVSGLRVSIAGINAAGANFEQLLFDGGSATLRRYLEGYFVPIFNTLADDDGNVTFAGVNSAAFGKTFSAPPLAFFMTSIISGGLSDTPHTLYDSNVSGVIASSLFGWTSANGVFSPRNLNYMVFDNTVR